MTSEARRLLRRYWREFGPTLPGLREMLTARSNRAVGITTVAGSRRVSGKLQVVALGDESGRQGRHVMIFQSEKWQNDSRREVAFLLGNGLTRLLDAPSWGRLLQSIDAAAWPDLADLPLPEQFTVLQRHGAAHCLDQVVRQCELINEAARTANPMPQTFALLGALLQKRHAGRVGSGTAVLTTNYDEALECLLATSAAPPRAEPDIETEFYVATDPAWRLTKLHGHWQVPDSIILGQDKYLALMARLAGRSRTPDEWLNQLGVGADVDLIVVGSSLDPTDVTLRWLLMARAALGPAKTYWIEPCHTPADAVLMQQRVRGLNVTLLAPILARRGGAWLYDSAFAEGITLVAAGPGAPVGPRVPVFVGLTAVTTVIREESYPQPRRLSLGVLPPNHSVRPGGSALNAALVAARCLRGVPDTTPVLVSEFAGLLGWAGDKDDKTRTALAGLLAAGLQDFNACVDLPVLALSPLGDELRHSVILCFKDGVPPEDRPLRLIRDLKFERDASPFTSNHEAVRSLWAHAFSSILFVDVPGVRHLEWLQPPTCCVVLELGTRGPKQGELPWASLATVLRGPYAGVPVVVTGGFPSFVALLDFSEASRLGLNDTLWNEYREWKPPNIPDHTKERSAILKLLESIRTSPEDAAQVVHGLRVRMKKSIPNAAAAIVTLHEEGALLLSLENDLIQHVAVPDGGPAASTYGAGDALRGALVAALTVLDGDSPVEGKALNEALSCAVRVASAFCVGAEFVGGLEGAGVEFERWVAGRRKVGETSTQGT